MRKIIISFALMFMLVFFIADVGLATMNSNGDTIRHIIGPDGGRDVGDGIGIHPIEIGLGRPTPERPPAQRNDRGSDGNEEREPITPEAPPPPELPGTSWVEDGYIYVDDGSFSTVTRAETTGEQITTTLKLNRKQL